MDRIWTIFLILFIRTVITFSATSNELKKKTVIILYLTDLSSNEERSKEKSLLWATEKVNKYENLPIKLGMFQNAITNYLS